MTRNTKLVGLSIPQNTYKKVEKLIKQRDKTRSEFYREMIDVYLSTLEKDVYDLIGDEIDKEKPVVLDIESIEILKPGKYKLDLVKLFKTKEPLIYKLEDGKYMVDLVESFKKMMGKKAE